MLSQPGKLFFLTQQAESNKYIAESLKVRLNMRNNLIKCFQS